METVDHANFLKDGKRVYKVSKNDNIMLSCGQLNKRPLKGSGMLRSEVFHQIEVRN
jgi:hypothetical protein